MREYIRIFLAVLLFSLAYGLWSIPFSEAAKYSDDHWFSVIYLGTVGYEIVRWGRIVLMIASVSLGIWIMTRILKDKPDKASEE